ncbi:MAG: DUF393 domain-containing protein [Thaumarchaeota archaeon]|nr:DUF393 domain-containing protein [Nitrososphaerota archaeon]
MFVLAYDSDCGPCTRFRRAVEFLDSRKALTYLGLDQAEAAGLLNHIPQNRRHRSFHLVASDGRVWSGAEALAPLASQLPGGRPFSFIVGTDPLAYRCAAFVYSTFSRLHDGGSCAYASGKTALTDAIDLDIKVEATKGPASGSPI